jgi:hypothetical protein
MVINCDYGFGGKWGSAYRSDSDAGTKQGETRRYEEIRGRKEYVFDGVGRLGSALTGI